MLLWHKALKQLSKDVEQFEDDCGEIRVYVRHRISCDCIKSQKNDPKTKEKVPCYSPNIQCVKLQVLVWHNPDLRFMKDSYTANWVVVNVWF